jgi:hypothetical protein
MSQLTMKAGQKDTHQGEVSVTRENIEIDGITFHSFNHYQ